MISLNDIYTPKDIFLFSSILNITVEYSANINLFKVNNKNTRKRCEICLKLTIKTLERRQ